MGIILISILVTGVFIAVLVSYYFIFPRKNLIDTNVFPNSYSIQSLNKIDIQRNYECAAFSSAYVLRHLGLESDGNELYKNYPRKLSDGTVSPKGIIIYFKKLRYDVSFYYGNVNTLKKQVNQGIPVIVFIRVFPDKRYLHFVPVVRYDKEYFNWQTLWNTQLTAKKHTITEKY
ncbi:cysteine peptidase family C39 domain-containing protein [Paenibacillus wynnii]|uniref:cysteine peptidase family C39 domain-containing protein n=1 Tax=Paenibacillus wynnii TaxID=268407 RepID=UPI00068FC25A|nr:cysteine peptidase family C39 domain-containing protein [Paenibacillus wynnii]